jgi:BclA C-terminal domain
MRKLILVLITGMFFAASASAQRQTKLYIDDNTGVFTTISTAGNGGSIILPSSGTLLTTSGGGTISGGAIWNGATIGVGYGGTGVSTTPSDGQLLIGNTSANGYSLTSLTAGTNVTITPGSGSITISATGGVTPAYLFAYNTAATTAPLFTAFTFPTLGSHSGIAASGAGFTIGATGVYLIQFSIYPSASNATLPDFAIQDNAASIGGGEFEGESATQPVNGSVIAPLTAGDVITVKNVGGNVALTSGSGAATTASIMITRIQ